MTRKTRSKKTNKIKVPELHDWRTTDSDEINRRMLRAETGSLRIINSDSSHPIFSTFHVKSDSGLTYSVEIRSISGRVFSCDCVDFRINGLGTCKHVEATLKYLQARYRSSFQDAAKNGSSLIDIVPDRARETLRIENNKSRPTKLLRTLFDGNGLLKNGRPEQTIDLLEKASLKNLRISQEVRPWLEQRRHVEERKSLQREYEQKVQSGEWPAHETLSPLYPYQREGMLHLAFKERALLADEMGLGKTIQAIAACALLHRLGKVSRVLIVTPASLKTEWEEQIGRFTTLPYQLVFGSRQYRLKSYSSAVFFTIVNYEQMLIDALDVNERLKPEVVVLDEAQRIKNWNTKTAQAVKRLSSRYAFVLTGTPIENRIDELYSLMSFLNPSVLGPLFRFNRDFYELDDRGRPCGYRNLEQLHNRIKPFMLRRRKVDVETELPDRSDRTFFVPLSGEQRNRYMDCEAQVARLASVAKRRPLTQQEADKLMRELAKMRMICDTNYILDPEERACPKLAELRKLLEECRENAGVKAIVFSEWRRMLELVQELCDDLKLSYALHSGSVPQRRRRAEILRFKSDPDCRVFLSTDSGSTGLNLQNASVVINCDLPWNPAKLEQRIARAWRKHQTQPVTVINLVSENTIEHKMVGTLASKQALAHGVLDLQGDLKQITYKSGRQAFVAKLQQLLGPPAGVITSPALSRTAPLPVDRSLAFSRLAGDKLGGSLVRCEERYPVEGGHSILVAVVDRDAANWRETLAPLHDELFGKGKDDPLAPVRLEVIDRATDDAIKRLIEEGLFTSTTRATRHLYPVEGNGSTAPALSEAEREKSRVWRQQAGRRLKMARLLVGGELLEEAREAQLEAILCLSRALAIENRSAEPAKVEDIIIPPASLQWGDASAVILEFVSVASAAVGDAANAIEKILHSPPNAGAT